MNRPECEALSQFVIYWNPADYPGQYVIRRWLIRVGAAVPGKVACLCESLELARSVFGWAGLVCLARSPGDDPVIVETWM